VNEQVCSTGSDFQPHLTYRQSKYQDPSAKFIVSAFRGNPMAALTCPETASCARGGTAGSAPKTAKPAKAGSSRLAWASEMTS
jgi:hypothetical protein